MFKMRKSALLLFFLGTAGVVFAQQPQPTVAIVLNQLTAQMGNTVSIAVEVRDAVNIAGTDVGITVDPTCLKITDRQTGSFLPTEADKKGFSAFSELHDHDTRLAASLLKDGPIANGQGVFFTAKLEVICQTGIAPINISFVELTSIEDPAAQNRKFLTYRLDKGEVNTINAQLAIGPVGQVTAAAPNTPSGQSITSVPNGTSVISTPQVQNPDASQNQAVPVVLIVLTIAGVILLIVVFWFLRRRTKDEDQE